MPMFCMCDGWSTQGAVGNMSRIINRERRIGMEVLIGVAEYLWGTITLGGLSKRLMTFCGTCVLV